MNNISITFAALIFIIFSSCSEHIKIKTKPKENQNINTAFVELFGGQWKTEGNEGIVAHWLKFDPTNSLFYKWHNDEAIPHNPTGKYQIIADTVLQLTYSEYNEKQRFVFENIQNGTIELLPLGVGAGNLIYKRGVPNAITFDKVRLTNRVDTIFSVEIPKARDLTAKNQMVTDSINAQILATFGIQDFNKNQSIEFRWGNIRSNFEIKEEVLYLKISATYYGGNYPNDYEYDIFFNLKSGEELFYTQLPFESLFTLSGYLDFLNKYWLAGGKDKFKAAEACAGSEALCSYYDISEYTVNDNKLSLSLTEYCFARVTQFCSPSYTVSVELDSVQQYLNNTGQSILAESNNFSDDPIDRIIANQKLFNRNTISNLPQNRHFIFGKIDDKYPISMALNIGTDGEVSGYYYYDNKRQKLSLEGEKKGNTISMTETVNDQTTGFFELRYSNDYEKKGLYYSNRNGDGQYIVGHWRNPENTRSFDIIFSEVKSITN